MEQTPIRLTQMTAAAGCAAKLGPGTLAKLLRGLPKFQDENLLVGFDTNDDACVYRLGEDLAMVQTVDFFPPMVDDPYRFGQIAAANALSDVYAMGARPVLAMNLLCVPRELPPEAVSRILAGGADKVKEAGAVLAGGHTIQDREPKYGLCVSGLVHPDRILTNSGARVGDKLILTKALGVGVLNTAAKGELLTWEEFLPALDSMSTLNRAAGEILVQAGDCVHACTDVTGFGLLGHAGEMAAGSGVTILLRSSSLPLLPKAAELARMGVLPSGMYRNKEDFGDKVRYEPHVPLELQDLAADPQTSGGLLAAVAPERAEALLEQLRGACPQAAVIGEVLPREEVSLILA